jgi:hypothetical protein
MMLALGHRAALVLTMVIRSHPPAIEVSRIRRESLTERPR